MQRRRQKCDVTCQCNFFHYPAGLKPVIFFQSHSVTMGTLAMEGAEAVNMLGGKFKVLTSTDQIKELQTIIRDKDTSRSDFKFVADRLIRMVIEEGLNQLPYQVVQID